MEVLTPQAKEKMRNISVGDLVEFVISSFSTFYSQALAPRNHFDKVTKFMKFPTNKEFNGIVVDKYKKSEQYKRWQPSGPPKMEIKITYQYHIMIGEDIIIVSSDELGANPVKSLKLIQAGTRKHGRKKR